MVLEARKSWIVHAVITARVVLASTPLLSSCATLFQPDPWARLVGIAELILGVIIATGWRTRYAAGLILLGTLGALSTNLSAFPICTASMASHTSVAVLLLASGFLLCFGRNDPIAATLSIRENNGLAHLDPSGVSGNFPDADVEITVRLETGILRGLHKRRCVVTFHDLNGAKPNTAHEVWYARDGR